MLTPWLRLFRVVNLPTVPGDVLAGAAVAIWACCHSAPLCADETMPVAFFAAASCCIYLFGLVDNDIVGAATDVGRPIPDGRVSMRSAKCARAACLALGLILVGAVGALPSRSGLAGVTAVSGLLVASALVAVIAAYNRTKRPLLMGLCRGVNVVLGVTAFLPPLFWPRLLLRAPLRMCAVGAVAAAWTAYIAAVTKYSEGEEADPARRRRVGALVGGVIWLQVAVLAVCAMLMPNLMPLLKAGAALLAVRWLARLALPSICGS